jgi:tetratricopeptide (TPR) repeat protein
MEYSEPENYLKTVHFREAMENFQFGEWQKGLVELNELMEKYPFDLELRALNQEMQIRARIDDEEIKENQRELIRRISFWGVRIAVIFVVLIAVVIGFQTYAGWVQQQYLQVQDRVLKQAYVLELAAKFRNGQNLYQAGFYTDALTLFQEIRESDPQYPQVDFYIQETQSLADLDVEYERALELVRTEKYEEAYEVFKTIANERPNFRDVLIRINDLEKNFLISDALDEANIAFQEQRWDDAISGYEYIRNLDPGYYSQEVEDYLYRSYVFAAEEALALENQTLESLKIAEDYFGRALTLRPQNPEIRARRALAREAYDLRLANSYIENAENVLTTQPDSLNALKIAEAYFTEALRVRPNDETILFKRDLAQIYLKAMDNFSLGFWDNTIELMTIVYSAEPDYASGTARQTLYEAYVARARNSLIVGDYNDGLEDAQSAAIIAQESPEGLLRLYESQLLVAEAQGLLGNFRESVLIYQAAVELSDIGNRAIAESPGLADAINYAGELANSGDYRAAFVAYRDALRQSGQIYTMVTHKVEEGEYLTQLARKYNTTVDAILEANGLSNRSRIELGTELIIPTLPGN